MWANCQCHKSRDWSKLAVKANSDGWVKEDGVMETQSMIYRPCHLPCMTTSPLSNLMMTLPFHLTISKPFLSMWPSEMRLSWACGQCATSWRVIRWLCWPLTKTLMTTSPLLKICSPDFSWPLISPMVPVAGVIEVNDEPSQHMWHMAPLSRIQWEQDDEV